jgi:hypothetical protein
MASPGEHTERTNCCTRRRGCLRMLNICFVLVLVIFIILQHNDEDPSMLVVYGIAAVLTLLSEFPYSWVKSFFWARACLLFFLGCLIAAIVRSLNDDTWDPFEFEGNAGDVIGLYLISVLMLFVIIMERWGVNGIYHNRANYDPDAEEPLAAEEVKSDGEGVTAQVDASEGGVSQV